MAEQKLSPAWIKNYHGDIPLDPSNMITGCPFHTNGKVIKESVPPMPHIDEINTLLSQEKSYTSITELVSLFNQEKDLRHNVYFKMFNYICSTIGPLYIEKLSKDLILPRDFFYKIISTDSEQLQEEIVLSIHESIKQHKNKDIFPYEEDEIFGCIQNEGHRKLGNGRGDNLYAASVMGFDMLVSSMHTYFYYIYHYIDNFHVWENDKKLNIPKHFYFGAKIPQAHSYLLNNVVAKSVYEKNKIVDFFDEGTITGYSNEIEDLFLEKLKDFSYSDFYEYALKFPDQSNLVLPLEKNSPCPAIGYFPQMWGICLAIMIEKYGE